MNQNDNVLNSWKEIAQYLGRGVRTVQRWEHDFGLPVRRPAGHVKSCVIALRSDIDRWMASCNLRLSATDAAGEQDKCAECARLRSQVKHLRQELAHARRDHLPADNDASVTRRDSMDRDVPRKSPDPATSGPLSAYNRS